MNQPQTTDAHAKDRAAIEHTLERFLDAWNKHDAHAFAMTFTEDADFTNVAGVHAHGRANVETFHARVFATLFKDSHQTAQIRSIRFLTPHLATVDVDWQMTGAILSERDSHAQSQRPAELGHGQAVRRRMAYRNHA
ncbi:MAG TPA: SgcJ/EcaC family oxidoreductase [Candidatus Acidoferrales bacterium]|nr:SgcJ/EcaC family oxidoreductase [Candidatus Acidoferrales bacterium]